MIEQERADALNLLVKQKQRGFKETFAELYLGERIDGISNDQQELDADSSGLGSELGGALEGEPAASEPERDSGGDQTERAGTQSLVSKRQRPSDGTGI